MKKTLLSGLVLGASLLGGVASADAPYIARFPFHNDMRAGALWNNDQPNNNNQRGAGCEHHALTYIKGANRIIYTGTCSYTDITPGVNPIDGSATPGQALGLSSKAAMVMDPVDTDANGIGVRAGGRDVNHRVEGLCASYSLDPQKGLVLQNTAYFTTNNNTNWKNAHKMALAPVHGGNAVLALYGFNPNGDAQADNGTNNTAVYGTVLGANCEQLSKQTLLVANTNDDLGGLSDGLLISNPDASNSAVDDVVFGLIGNGNGDDNGWYANVSATYTGGTGTGSYTLKQNFKQTVVQNEERSRMTLVPHPTDPTLALAVYAEGNSQPPNNGVRLSLVHIDKNFAAQGIDEKNAASARIVWRQYLMQRQGNIYYATPSIVPMRDAAGNATSNFMVTYTMVDTTNRNGRQKGKTAIYTAPIQISDTGFTLLDQPKTGLFGLADGAHPGMVEGSYNGQSVAFMFQGSITDGGSAALKVIGMDGSNKLSAVKALNWADSTSGGYTSQWYGENPNTPQGRTYPPHGILVDNPGYKQQGGFQPTVSKFLLVAHSHHLDHTGQCGPNDPTPADPSKGTNNGTCGAKNATSMVMIPVAADETSDPNQGNDPTQGGSGSSPSDPTDPGTTLGGCSTSGTGGAGTLFLVGMAVAAIRRRRSSK